MNNQEAIYCLKNELEQYAKQYPETSKNYPLCVAMQLVIAALEKQREIEPCEYCEQLIKHWKDYGRVNVTISGGWGNIDISFSENDLYCAHCGRQLDREPSNRRDD